MNLEFDHIIRQISRAREESVSYDELHKRLLDVKHEFHQRLSEVRQDAINASTAKIKTLAVEETQKIVKQTVDAAAAEAVKRIDERAQRMRNGLIDLLEQVQKRIQEFDVLSASRALPERIRINTTLRY